MEAMVASRCYYFENQLQKWREIYEQCKGSYQPGWTLVLSEVDIHRMWKEVVYFKTCTFINYSSEQCALPAVKCWHRREAQVTASEC